MRIRPAASNSIGNARLGVDAIKIGRFAITLTLCTIFWLLVWYGDTVHAMVSIWWENNTYTQCFLIAPICAWLIWQRRRDVAALDLQPDFRALPVIALVGFGWLLGRLADVGMLQPLFVVLLIPLTVWAVLGFPVVRALAFPLFFLFFAIPFGNFLIEPMMEYTADFTVAALKLTGIPVYREGQFFMIPSGSWSVVEACAGLRYLIASLTVGVLFAYLIFRSITRRLIFIALSVIVPIVANWLRAYLVVMIGHLSENKYGKGFDHLVGGWLFFGIVMLALFWLGSRFREDLDDRTSVSRRASQATLPGNASLVTPTRRSLAQIMLATIAVAGVGAFWPGVAGRLENTGPYVQPLLLAPLRADNWQPVVAHEVDWVPSFRNPSARIHQSYGTQDTRAGLYVAYYRNQRQGAELITSDNTLVSRDERAWSNTSQTERRVALDHGQLSLTEAKLSNGSTNVLVWSWYWVDGKYVASQYRGKLLQAKSRLLGNGDDAAAIIVYESYDGSPELAEKVLYQFVNAALPAVTQTLERAQKR